MAAFETVDDYIASFPASARPALEAVRRAIHDALPGGYEAISYGIPVIGRDGRHLVWFAGWKRYVSLYPIPAGDPALTAELAPYVAGKGTLRFMLSTPLPIELIGRAAAALAPERHAPPG
jgi:uncharacterized protein YdhG (YjbR/CyaY superfamily)